MTDRHHRMTQVAVSHTGTDFYHDGPPTVAYQLGKLLGEGSFATVKLAVCKADRSRWAVKCIKKDKLGAEDEEALQEEVSILERLSHPNIVNIKEVYDTDDVFYMIMELDSGGELFDRIVERDHYTEGDARLVIRQVGDALAYCHNIGVVHRDLKPENLLLADSSETAEVKIADFGLAHIVHDNEIMTTACGTPGYVAPEVLGGHGYHEKVDVWSTGVILYILLCGFPPFYDDDNRALFETIKRGDYDFPSPWWDPVSDLAKDLIRQCMCLDPDQRLSAAGLLRHEWVVDHNESVHDTDISASLRELRGFNARRKFKGAIDAVRMIRRVTKAVAPSANRGGGTAASKKQG